MQTDRRPTRPRAGLARWLTGLAFGALSLVPLVALAADPATTPMLRLETGMHTASINRIATDAKGRWLVTASDDKTARVWEIEWGGS